MEGSEMSQSKKSAGDPGVTRCSEATTGSKEAGVAQPRAFRTSALSARRFDDPACPLGSFRDACPNVPGFICDLIDEMMETAEGRAELQRICDESERRSQLQ